MFGNLANMLKNRTNRLVDVFLLIIDRTYIDVGSLLQANLALNFVVDDGICRLCFRYRNEDKEQGDNRRFGIRCFPTDGTLFRTSEHRLIRRSRLHVLRSMTPFRGFESTSSKSDLSNAMHRNPRRKEQKVSDATCNTTKNERIVNRSIMWSR